MDGLFKKVMEGVFPPIPKQYSIQLSQLIKSLIKINPNERPTCKFIITNSTITTILKDYGFISNDQEIVDELLHTIKVPKKLKAFALHLPKPNYNNLNKDNNNIVDNIKSEQNIFGIKNCNSQINLNSEKQSETKKFNEFISKIYKNKGPILVSEKSRENCSNPSINKIYSEKKITNNSKYTLVQNNIKLGTNANQSEVNLAKNYSRIDIIGSRLNAQKSLLTHKQKNNSISKDITTIRPSFSIDRSSLNHSSNKKIRPAEAIKDRRHVARTPQKAPASSIIYKNVSLKYLLNKISPKIMNNAKDRLSKITIDRSKLIPRISNKKSICNNTKLIQSPTSIILKPDLSLIEKHYSKYLEKHPKC